MELILEGIIRDFAKYNSISNKYKNCDYEQKSIILSNKTKPYE